MSAPKVIVEPTKFGWTATVEGGGRATVDRAGELGREQAVASALSVSGHKSDPRVRDFAAKDPQFFAAVFGRRITGRARNGFRSRRAA